MGKREKGGKKRAHQFGRSAHCPPYLSSSSVYCMIPFSLLLSAHAHETRRSNAKTLRRRLMKKTIVFKGGRTSIIFCTVALCVSLA